MYRPILLAGIGLVAALLPAPVAAQDWRVGNESYHLVFTGLDLGTAKGRATALARVERAALKLCDGHRAAVDRRACVAETVAAATARQPAGQAIARALAEREATRLAQR